MHERMLNKQEQPTFEALIAYCGDSGRHWLALDKYLQAEFDASKLIRFPYGKDYGWGVKYSQKRKHICDVFAEKGAFTVFFQIASAAVDAIYSEMDDYAKGIWKDKYPCASGGWVRFRVLNHEQLEGVKKIIQAKMAPRRELGGK